MLRKSWTFCALVVWGAACAPGGADADRDELAARDLTTAGSANAEQPVVSDLELGLAVEPARVADLVADDPSVSSPAVTEAESIEPAISPTLVSWTDGIELGSQPREITASLPIMGAGAGTLLNPGVTVTTKGPPVDLFRNVATRDSPWPEAKPGEYPGVDRNSPGLLVSGGGGHGGACPAPGRAFLGRFDQPLRRN